MAASTKLKIVGTHSLNYAEKRLFAGIPLQHYEVKKLKDLIRIPAHLYWKFKGKPHPYFTNLFWDLGINNYQLLHFFNAVNIGNQPWLTTFERYLPRDAHHPGVAPKENLYIDFVIKRLAHSSCKKLIAISDYAYRSQVRYLKEYGKLEEQIMQKVVVLHPPQRAMIESIEEKNCDKNLLTCTVVGADFFRKGGKEILHVFDRLLQEKKHIQLNIISSLDYGDYASRTTKADQQNALEIIAKYPQIKHYQAIPNSQVMEILKASDLSLLPTYDDTYGYFVLESQAMGCPVISTNGGALPEVNSSEAGWLIDVPLYEDGRSIPRETEQRRIFSEQVENNLYKILSEVLDTPQLIKQKGAIALARIKAEHDLIEYTKKIESIYNEALS